MGQINVDKAKYYIKPEGKTALLGTKNVTANFLKELPEKDFNALVEKFRFDHQLLAMQFLTTGNYIKDITLKLKVNYFVNKMASQDV